MRTRKEWKKFTDNHYVDVVRIDAGSLTKMTPSSCGILETIGLDKELLERDHHTVSFIDQVILGAIFEEFCNIAGPWYEISQDLVSRILEDCLRDRHYIYCNPDAKGIAELERYVERVLIELNSLVSIYMSTLPRNGDYHWLVETGDYEFISGTFIGHIVIFVFRKK